MSTHRNCSDALTGVSHRLGRGEEAKLLLLDADITAETEVKGNGVIAMQV